MFTANKKMSTSSIISSANVELQSAFRSQNKQDIVTMFFNLDLILELIYRYEVEIFLLV